ncbi:hypothetical protein B4N89_27425 [Embleya scabrispora]|uniref:Uncharacterized protein n=1 Tax=Embleya scabrispora TaxID=159449 RepID=A0A1T3P4Y9_9ACTN|nr:hypothetical protein [Embleya scabrispora]OPC84159.1 hypothetical protein B4N89_27425 [Embleya scabrispora]
MTETHGTVDSEVAVPHYEKWSTVPRYLLTRTQHAELDLPRTPSGRVAARVTGKDFKGKRATFDLFDVRESTPTRTGVARLLASDPALYTCGHCGAHDERPTNARLYGSPLLCSTCFDADRIAVAQQRARNTRADQTTWARKVLADPSAVWVHVHKEPRVRAGDGGPRCPVWTVTAVDATRAWVLRMVVRPNGARAANAPASAVDEATAAKRIARKLGGRRIVAWDYAHAEPLIRWAKQGGRPVVHDFRDALHDRLVGWRGLVDRRGHVVHTCVSPGRADRLLVATVRMAEITSAADDHRALLVADPGATVVDIAGRPESALRLHAILRAVGVVVGDAEPTLVEVPDAGGMVRLRILCHRDGVVRTGPLGDATEDA